MSTKPVKKFRSLETIREQQKRNLQRFFTISGLVVITTIGLVIWLSWSNTALFKGPLHSQTYAIAGNFMCACGKCKKNLATCGCAMKGGGLEEMRFISDLLETGIDETQIIQRVQDQYGHYIDKSISN